MECIKIFWSKILADTPKRDKIKGITASIGALITEIFNEIQFSDDPEIDTSLHMLLHSVAVSLFAKAIYHAQKIKK